MKINNPIIPGYNPDPSILKHGDDYFIAVSTFEWMSGVRIYHSKDLVNWDYYSDVLSDELVDFLGNPKDGSVWAPQISFYDGEFYLVYTDVKSTIRPFKDAHNYVVKAPSLKGPWSKPIYLTSSGFDPSLYHEEDQSYLLMAVWDYRKETPNKSVGISIQAYDRHNEVLVGEPKHIFPGSKLQKTEAPHIYKVDGWYYLITAEGGTGSGHAVSICRSKDVFGPYELDPMGPVMSSTSNPNWPLQNAGHGSLVQADDKQWYMAHLTTRPINGEYAIMGRETALQKVQFKDGWLRLMHDSILPEVTLDMDVVQKPKEDIVLDFSKGTSYHMQTLRTAIPSSLEKMDANGLHLTSQESIHSLFKQSLYAMRQDSFAYRASLTYSFNPKNPQQLAGLVHYINASSYMFFYKTWDEEKGLVLRQFQSENGEFTLNKLKVAVDHDTEVRFETDESGLYGQYAYKQNDTWHNFGEPIHLGFLSGGFTGTMVGVAVYDLHTLHGATASFKEFKYERI